jgi:ABC-2 type transport system permease protein
MRLAEYVGFARIAAVQVATDRGELLGRLAFVVVILGVFSALWRAVGEAGMPLPVDTPVMVWYLAVTEWIVLSPLPVHVDIESDVRRGDIAYQVGRPYSYLTALFAQGVGALAVRAPLVGLTAFACALGFTGRLPPESSLGAVVPFGLVAMIVLYGLYVLTGLAAFWLGDVTPLFWVWQKLLFILGGLMLPLAIYPEWMQRVAWLTPFPALLAGPADFMIGGGDGWWLALRLGGWAIAIALLARALFGRAVRTLTVNGG